MGQNWVRIQGKCLVGAFYGTKRGWIFGKCLVEAFYGTKRGWNSWKVSRRSVLWDKTGLEFMGSVS
ncbi:hypothetical protein CD29_17990 [Ureibacillus manganicus DSM 26584]|uniref:Uncharacterized protein n=1 Tax=Ureibacillus manganicus DSM 26584 TaxID=1384049 RepID=A0A0A3HSA8_9BACL|nr:hypothetical protein CD29_17990 [Ureibacillus manganicus DSM 26584]